MTEIDSGTDFIVTLVKGQEHRELTIRSSTADGAADYAKLVVEHQPQDYAGFLIYSIRKALTDEQFVMRRRSIPEQIRYAAASLQEGKIPIDAVILTLEVIANEIEANHE
jgi:hypothetical protein